MSFSRRRRRRRWRRRCWRGGRALHGHVAVGAAVSERAALLLEGDEVPHGDHGVVRHVEVKQLHTGEGLERAQLARRPGEVLGHEEAICGRKRRVVSWRRGPELGVHLCEELWSYFAFVALANNRLPRSIFVLADGDLCIINMLAAGVL